jgi:Response regulators consisting of a CheY-like receiver domain and a winged-helix DNA-binding domain
MVTKILIVEDEKDILEMLSSFFRKKGYEVITATEGYEAIKKAELIPNIILLDIGLPNLSGLEVCQRIREFVNCPIIFLTARVEEMDKVKGFSVGADDYVVKPFSVIELEARIQAHLRREKRHRVEAKIMFDEDLSIDYGQRCVYFKEEIIHFAKKEFDIIELLSQNRLQIFDRERIYEIIWGYDGEGDSQVVTEHIRRIRAKLADSTNKNYIETIWGVGYKWVK